jgi:hypothetical protein
MLRIDALDKTKWQNCQALHNFLAYRCSREFLVRYTESHPEFVGNLEVGSYLYAVSDVDVLVRLHAFGLLPEEIRRDVVKNIRSLAVSTPDAGFLDKRIGQLLLVAEVDEILEQVRDELLPSLNERISEWRGNFSTDEDPENHFSELKSALKDFRERFVEEENSVSLIDDALAEIDTVIEDLRSETPPEPDYDDLGDDRGPTSDDMLERSIFDDVDA